MLQRRCLSPSFPLWAPLRGGESVHLRRVPDCPSTTGPLRGTSCPRLPRTHAIRGGKGAPGTVGRFPCWRHAVFHTRHVPPLSPAVCVRQLSSPGALFLHAWPFLAELGDNGTIRVLLVRYDSNYIYAASATQGDKFVAMGPFGVVGYAALSILRASYFVISR